MSERQPTQPDKSEERLFYEATIEASKERNPGLVALELNGDIVGEEREEAGGACREVCQQPITDK
jgi:hypothetical protein